jgi:hypothetical protein
LITNFIGSASLSYQEIKAYTYRYLIDTKNIDDLNGISFDSPFERLKTEFRLIASTVFSLAT